MTTAAFRPAGPSQNLTIALLPALAAWCLLASRLDSGAPLAAIALVPAAAAAVVDLESHRIPDRLVVLTVVPSLVALVFSGVAVASVAVGAVAMGMPLLAVHVIDPAAIGFGDVKLGAALGAALGLVDGRLALLALMLASGATLLIAFAHRRSSLPFAPALVLAASVVVAVSSVSGWGVAR